MKKQTTVKVTAMAKGTFGLLKGAKYDSAWVRVLYRKYVLQFSTITTDALTLKGLGWRGKRYRWMSIPKVAKAMKNQRAKEAKLMSW